jgi:two-component sensor histidine kinase
MAMALVHETLYQSSSLSAIDLKLYVQKLAGILGAAHGANRRRLALVLEVDSLPIGIDHAVPCGLIINELAVNAFQHAFPQDGPGRISITARETKDGKVQLIVADDGIGLPPDAERPMSNTLGLTLVRGLARQQLGGELNVDVNGGTRFTITFPNRERSVEPPDLIS